MLTAPALRRVQKSLQHRRKVLRQCFPHELPTLRRSQRSLRGLHLDPLLRRLRLPYRLLSPHSHHPKQKRQSLSGRRFLTYLSRIPTSPEKLRKQNIPAYLPQIQHVTALPPSRHPLTAKLTTHHSSLKTQSQTESYLHPKKTARPKPRRKNHRASTPAHASARASSPPAASRSAGRSPCHTSTPPSADSHPASPPLRRAYTPAARSA